MKQASIRIRLQDSLAADPTEHHFENVHREDGFTPFDLLLDALKNLSLSHGDVDILPPTMMLDAAGAVLGIADLYSPFTDAVTYEFALVKRVSNKPVIGANPGDSGNSHVSFEVMEATELDASLPGSAEFRQTLLQEIARYQVEYEKVNSWNWWWDRYKLAAAFAGVVFGEFCRRLGFCGSGQQSASGGVAVPSSPAIEEAQ
ncbi:hypothetical protein AAVH_34995 [Aphelenchoides avenae]|nr:hypothetical protein AAVH_34995 [Aphelenchus avenae]